MNVDKHAYKVVQSFKKSLNKQQRKTLTNENYEELQILIEAALGSTAEVALHDTAKSIEKLARKIRKQASAIEKLEK
jgi:uncharacterized phage infection (PIP) family protein YhgE